MGVQVEYISQVGGCTSKMNEGSKDWKIYIVDAKVQRCKGAMVQYMLQWKGGVSRMKKGWDGMGWRIEHKQ